MQSTVIWTWCLCLLLIICTASSKDLADYSCPKKCHCFPSTVDQQSDINLKCENLKTAHKFISSVEHANRIVSIQATTANISKIDPVYSKCTNLRKVDLSLNNISSLKIFANFPKLMDLNLSRNNISKLNQFSLPQSIVHVNFSYNSISELPWSLTKLTSLKSFDITNNPINCLDCGTLFVKDWLIQNNVKGHSNVQCHFPRSLYGFLWSDVKTSSSCKSHIYSRYRRTTNDHLVYYEDQFDGSGDASDERIRIPLLGEGIEFDASGDGDHDMDLFIPVVSTPSSESKPKPVEKGTNDDDFHFEDGQEMFTVTDGNFSDKYEDGSGSGDDSIIIGQPLTSTEFFGSGDISLSTTEPSLITTTEEEFGSGLSYDNIDSKFDRDESDNDTIFDNDISFDNDMIEHPNRNDNGTRDGEEISTTVVTTVLLQPVTEVIIKHPDVIKLKTAKISELNIAEGKNEYESTTAGKNKSSITVEQQDNKQPLGTYIFLAILIAVLICLMGYAIIKSNLRNRKRNRSSDTEKAEVEMGDMTKTPLVKNDSEDTVKVNGKPETIPLSSSEERLDKVADEPEHLGQEVANELSLSPTNGLKTPTPLTPEAERVKIRVSELPDSILKTPVLVTRTRSNAGDFIVTPNETFSSHN